MIQLESFKDGLLHVLYRSPKQNRNKHRLFYLTPQLSSQHTDLRISMRNLTDALDIF